jgi:hypothetical protein
MWKEWFLFEVGQIDSRDNKEKVAEISEIAKECLLSCGLDLRTFLGEMYGRSKKKR